MKKLILYFLILCLSVISVNAQKEGKIKSVRIQKDSINKSHKSNLFPYNSKPIYFLNGNLISFENL